MARITPPSGGGSVTLTGQAVGGDLTGNWPDLAYGAGSVVDADVNAAAGIARSKMAAVEAVRVVGAGGEPAFGTNWGSLSALDNTYKAFGFYLEGDRVWFDGVAYASGAPGATLFTLPTGYRPAKIALVNLRFYDSSANVNLIAAAQVLTDGQVLPSHPTVAPASGDQLGFDGVSFRL